MVRLLVPIAVPLFVGSAAPEVILTEETNSAEGSGQLRNLHTKFGKVMRRALGDSDDLNQFVKLHYELKMKRQHGKQLSQEEVRERQHAMVGSLSDTFTRNLLNS